MLAVILLSVLIVAIAFVGIGVRIFFHKSHQFPETDAGHSPQLRKQGIRCPREEDAKLHSGSTCAACHLD